MNILESFFKLRKNSRNWLLSMFYLTHFLAPNYTTFRGPYIQATVLCHVEILTEKATENEF